MTMLRDVAIAPETSGGYYIDEKYKIVHKLIYRLNKK